MAASYSCYMLTIVIKQKAATSSLQTLFLKKNLHFTGLFKKKNSRVKGLNTL